MKKEEVSKIAGPVLLGVVVGIIGMFAFMAFLNSNKALHQSQQIPNVVAVDITPSKKDTCYEGMNKVKDELADCYRAIESNHYGYEAELNEYRRQLELCQPEKKNLRMVIE